MTVTPSHYLPLSSRPSKNRKYISEYPDPTYHTAQKGLTLLGVALLDEDEILSINELHEYITSAYLTSPEDIKKLWKLTSKLPNSMKSFMEQIKVFANLLYALFTASFPLFLELKKTIYSLMEYKPAARALTKRQQRAAIAWIINLQTKHLFRRESNQLAEFVLMNKNLREKNPLIYYAEVPLSLIEMTSRPQLKKKQVL